MLKLIMFKTKRTTFTQNIVLIAIMSAINVIFALIGALIPFAYFVIALILPFVSSIVGSLCLKRYFPIYIITALGLSFIVSMFNLDGIIFYLLPSIISGLLIGVLSRTKISIELMIIITSLFQFIFYLATIPLINFIFETDFLAFLIKVFFLEDSAFAVLFAYLIIFIVSFIQSVLSNLIFDNQLL